jgi:hypothetical protein
MKKIMLIIMVLALSVPLLAGASFSQSVTVGHSANQAVPIITGSGNPGAVVSLSKNVSLAYTTDTATDFEQQEYSLGAYHTSGDKEYGTAYDTTIIKWNIKTDKVDLTAQTESDSSEYSAWTSM